jgi:hypothetical protein
MTGILLSLVLVFAGISLLRLKFNVSDNELQIMFVGACLIAVVRDLTAIILLLIAGFSGAVLAGLLLNLVIDSAFSYYFMKQSGIL